MTTDTAPAATRSQGRDLLRVLSICAVVSIHIFGGVAANPEIEGSASAWIARVLAVGSIWSVPVFVMLAGSLNLTDRAHRDGPGSFYSRRARRIIPALVFWTFVYLVLVRMLLLDEPMWGWKIVTLLTDATVYPHLYFLWLIAGLYLAAPLLHAFLAKGGTRRAVFVAGVALGLTLVTFMVPGVLALGGVERHIQLTALTFWIAYVGYFLMGHALSRVTVPRRWLAVAGVGVVALGALAVVQSAYPQQFRLLSAVSPVEYLGTGVALLSICVMVIGVPLLDRVRLGPRLQRLSVTLSEATFGVYLVHFVILLVPYELLTGFKQQWSLPEAMLAYLFVLIASFAVSVVARKIPVIRTVF